MELSRRDLSQWVERWAAFQPDKAAIVFDGREITYGDLEARVRRLASALKHGLGIGRGDRIAHLGHNSPEFIDLVFAAARLGAMVVPLNWRLAPPEHAYILRNAAVSALLAEPAFEDHVAAIGEAVGDGRPVLYGASRPGWLDYRALLDAATGDDRNPHVSLETPLLVCYTSGTTGRPKGAVLTQEAVLWNAVNSTVMHDLASPDRVLTTLPLFHVGGLNIQTLPALHAGATVFLHARFDPGATLAAFREVQPTLTVLVPAQLDALSAHPDWARTDLGSLRMVTTGSTFVPTSLIERWHARGVPVVQVYGSTETGPIAIHQRADEAFRTVGSTGRPALHCRVRIVDDAGRDLGPGERGEILVAGPNVLFEYWGDPEATAEALRDGWYHTGDVGHVDERGLYYIDERKRDVIISGSENIYPAELEAVLAECPDIAEAAVVARPDPRWGEVPVAFVVLREQGALDRDGVLALFEGRLARFKHPKDVVFADALPRNALGKVLRYRLRELARG